jgi:hypothetical protein
MSVTWGSNRPIVSSLLVRGILYAVAWQAGAALIVWFVVRHSSLWVKP